jgi:hypothetical protein
MAEREEEAPDDLSDCFPPEQEVATAHARISHDHRRKAPIGLLHIFDRLICSFQAKLPVFIAFRNPIWLIELKTFKNRDTEARGRKETTYARIG